MQLSKHLKWRKLNKNYFKGGFSSKIVMNLKWAHQKNVTIESKWNLGWIFCHIPICDAIVLIIVTRHKILKTLTSVSADSCVFLWGMTVLQSVVRLRLVFERRFVHVFSQPGEIVPFRKHFRQLVKDLSVATIQMWPGFGETP